jgi:hypothetical protein
MQTVKYILLIAALALTANSLRAQAHSVDSVDKFVASIPPEFPPSSLPWLLDVGAANLPPTEIEDLSLGFRKHPDLAEFIEKLDEDFREHRLAQSPAERRLEVAREAKYRSPIINLAVDLSHRLPDLIDVPANTALRAVGRELAGRFVKSGVDEKQINGLLLRAHSLDAGTFLQSAKSFISPQLLASQAYGSLSLAQQADLMRNILAGALIDETSSVIRFPGSPPTDNLVGLAREALIADAKLLVEEKRLLYLVEETTRTFQDSSQVIEAQLESERDTLLDLGETLRGALSPREEDKVRYRELADQYLRHQNLVEVLTSGTLSALPGPDQIAVLNSLIPPEFKAIAGLEQHIQKIAAVPVDLGREVGKLLDGGRQAMTGLDAFARGANLSMEVEVGGVHFDADKLAGGVFRGCFESAVATSGLTVEFGSGQLDVASLVGGLSSNNILAAVGASNLKIDIGGNSVDVVGLASNLATGNFLGAIGGLFGSSGSPFGSLFGGGGSGGQDLKAVRQQLEQIQRTLEQIVRQLDRIEHKIDNLREEVRQDHLETMAKLNQISLDLTVVRIANMQIFEGQAGACKVIEDLLGQKTSGVTATQIEEADLFEGKKTYEEIRQMIFNPVYRQVEECHDYVIKKLHQDRIPFDLTLMLNQGLNDRASEARQALHDKYLVPHLSLLTSAFRKKPERLQIQASLLDAQPTIDSVQLRLKGTRSVSTSVDAVNVDAFEPFQIIDPESLSTFIKHVFMIQRLFPYFNFRHDEVVSTKCILDGFPCLGTQAKVNGTLTRDRILQSLRLVNTSIAQQALFNGDVLLPKAAEVLKSGMDGSSKDSKDLNEVFNGNPIFTSNLVHYLLRERLELQGYRTRASQYALAHLYAEKSNGDASFLELLFPNPEFGKSPSVFFLNKPGEPIPRVSCKNTMPGRNGVYLQLPSGHCAPLPDQQAFATGALEVTPAWSKAMALREKLLDEWTGYTFRATLDKEARRTYDSLNLINRALKRELVAPAPH